MKRKPKRLRLARYRRLVLLYTLRGAASGAGAGAVSLVVLYIRHRF